MSLGARKSMMAAAFINGASASFVEDLFSSYTYTGTGGALSIVNGLDLLTEGGLVWCKNRTSVADHTLFNTESGANNYQVSNDASAGIFSVANTLTAFGNDGFDLGSAAPANSSGQKYISWAFRRARNFFHCEQVVKASSITKTVDLSSLGTVGLVMVRRTDAAGSWHVWHRSLSAGKLLLLESTAAEATLGHISVAGTDLSLVDGIIANGTYMVYAWAHDDSEEGVIQCGSFTTIGAALEVSLGWEPQFILCKRKTVSAKGWVLVDSLRGLQVDRSAATVNLAPNISSAEAALGEFGPTANGFTYNDGGSADAYVYIAIRRPMKVPDSGSGVFYGASRAGTSSLVDVLGAGFAPDLAIVKRSSDIGNFLWFDRLRGRDKPINSAQDWAELSQADSLTAFLSDGITVHDASGFGVNYSGTNYMNWLLRRAPGFMDIVCDIGTGANHAIAHNLGVAPEFVIRKKRSAADYWCIYHSGNTANPETDYLINTNAATADDNTLWNDTAPTEIEFFVGTNDDVNQSTATFVTYLFATLAGVSKVGSYVGTAALQDLDFGFSAGARFFLCKRTDAAGDWFVFDTIRGIVAGDDPYLIMNSNTAQIGGVDLVDPLASGLTLTAAGSATININGASYIYLAIA